MAGIGTSVHLARAVEALTNKPPIPDIDFTQHQLEDGVTVSTQERIVKEVRMSHSLNS